MSKLDDARYELIEKREELPEVDYVRQLDVVKDEGVKTGLVGGFVMGIFMTILTMEMIEEIVEAVALLLR